jgi:cytochrome c-type biogenesis protein CcmH/NrfG
MYTAAITERPKILQAYVAMGDLLLRRGKTAAALDSYAQALLLRSDYVPAMNALARVLSIHPDRQYRNGSQAVQLAERACILDQYQTPELMDTLAAAYAEGGHYRDAVDTVSKAIAAAESGGQDSLAQEMRDRLELYKSGQPYRE